MEKNNMLDKTIIIITGELAAGKTTYGRKIAEHFQIPFFSKDAIKELLYDSLISENADYETKRKLGATSYKIFYYILEEEMKSNKTFVAESNFIKESIPIVKELIEKYGYNSLTIRFEGDLKVLHKRFLDREHSSERHPGLQANGVFDDFENFRKTSIKSKEFKINDKEIIVDTTDFGKVNFEDIIKKLL